MIHQPVIRIIFMGTPDFAVPTLDLLVLAGFDLVGVVTATDKWGGRGGKKRIVSAVKSYAHAKGIKVLQPKNLKARSFQEELQSLQPDLQVVVAFRMLPEVVWSLPPLGTINLHASLLPKYRGAAPINWAIINGEVKTGLTTFFIQKEIDTGNLLLQDSLEIGPEETAGELHDRMKVVGARLVLGTVEGVVAGTIEPIAQDHSLATKAPKIYHSMCRIDFTKSSAQVHNFIRGMSPYPGAWTILDGLELKILRATTLVNIAVTKPGHVHIVGRKSMLIATADGFIAVKELQMQGKKRMDVRSFLNGYTPAATSVL
ncbi:MAG: methionyl-tRNA formyltransferase [Saprospiraceae bacterium]|nr:methionyl-tRNA formyltransferase [Saprospiraceae bacterium]